MSLNKLNHCRGSARVSSYFAIGNLTHSRNLIRFTFYFSFFLAGFTHFTLLTSRESNAPLSLAKERDIRGSA